MTNSPLTSPEQYSIVAFIMLLTPTVALGIGVLPALFIGIGLYLMKKRADFSYIETAVKFVKGYLVLVLAMWVGFAVFLYLYSYGEEWIALGFAALTYVYFWLVDILFHRPLKTHSEWVSVNGIFSSEPKVATQTKGPQVDILKDDGLKSYSVADELLKWAKLKESGLISEDEFAEARRKLLQRS